MKFLFISAFIGFAFSNLASLPPAWCEMNDSRRGVPRLLDQHVQRIQERYNGLAKMLKAADACKKNPDLKGDQVYSAILEMDGLKQENTRKMQSSFSSGGYEQWGKVTDFFKFDSLRYGRFWAVIKECESEDLGSIFSFNYYAVLLWKSEAAKEAELRKRSGSSRSHLDFWPGGFDKDRKIYQDLFESLRVCTPTLIEGSGLFKAQTAKPTPEGSLVKLNQQSKEFTKFTTDQLKRIRKWPQNKKSYYKELVKVSARDQSNDLVALAKYCTLSDLREMVLKFITDEETLEQEKVMEEQRKLAASGAVSAVPGPAFSLLEYAAKRSKERDGAAAAEGGE
jgi:hypothetical protein